MRIAFWTKASWMRNQRSKVELDVERVDQITDLSCSVGLLELRFHAKCLAQVKACDRLPMASLNAWRILSSE